MIQLVATLVAGYLALIIFLYFYQRRLIYNPGHEVLSPSDTVTPNMGVVTTNTVDGVELKSWYQEPKSSGAQTIIYFQGNAGTIADRDEKIKAYLDAGFGGCLVGYRGFAGNAGNPSEHGLYNDGRSILNFLRERNQKSSNWIFYGESLGTGVATHLAAELAELKQPIAALILEAPYTSMGDVAAQHYPYIPSRKLVREKFSSLEKIHKINTPLLVIHGELDPVIKIDLGKRLFALAKEPKKAFWVPAARHNDLYSFGASQAVLTFLGEHLSV